MELLCTIPRYYILLSYLNAVPRICVVIDIHWYISFIPLDGTPKNPMPWAEQNSYYIPRLYLALQAYILQNSLFLFRYASLFCLHPNISLDFTRWYYYRRLFLVWKLSRRLSYKSVTSFPEPHYCAFSRSHMPHASLKSRKSPRHCTSFWSTYLSSIFSCTPFGIMIW